MPKGKARKSYDNFPGAVAYRARIIHCAKGGEVCDLPDALLGVSKGGKILFCGKAPKEFRGKVKDLRGRLIIPGLIDVHSHIPQLDVRGKHGATLLDWLERYVFPAERAFANPKVVEDVARRFFKKLILNGTSTSCLYSTVHKKATNLCFEIAKSTGLRVAIGKVMMDVNSPKGLIEDPTKSLSDSESLCAKWHNASDGKLKYAFTPRFAPTSSAKLWKQSASLANQCGAYVQSHIAETKGENEAVRAMYPHIRDYVEFMESAETLGSKTILAHAIYLSDDEYKRLARSGTKIAHCPTSNYFLKSGRMSVARVMTAGCEFALGTDVGAGTSMSIFTEMRHSDYAQNDSSVTPEKAFYLATQGGAKVMSMEGEIGNFDAGKFADFCVVDISGTDPKYKLCDLDTDEVLSLMMYRGDGRLIESLFVGGKKLDVDGF